MVHLVRYLIIFPLIVFSKKLFKHSSIFVLLSVFLLTIIIFWKEEAENFCPLKSNDVSFEQEDLKQRSQKKIITIKKGDTLSKLLYQQQLPNSDVQAIIKLANAKKISSQLKIGQKLIFEYKIQLRENQQSDLNEEYLRLDRMVLLKNKLNSTEFVRQLTDERQFTSHDIKQSLKKLVTSYHTKINSSLINSLRKTGLSSDSIVRLINAYSHQIDFQRQIRPGDKISIITEKYVTKDNEFSHYGRILHANLTSRGKDYSIFHYSPTGKLADTDFFSADGKSIKKSLLKTPVKIVRISSNYGYRKHPVLGYGKMHKGVDFAGSIGTPIYAAGSGVIDFIGWKSGYGRFILLKHNSSLSTAYAHASRFTKGLKKGMKVKQGDIIAYVGKSGRVTGPHLHYEVRINGKQVNPMKFKPKADIQLNGKNLLAFKEHCNKIRNLTKKLHNINEMEVTIAKKQKLL